MELELSSMLEVYIGIFTVITLLCALGVLFSRHPIGGALNLIGVMLSLSGIYALLAGPFLAIVQILVYTGGILMLVVFVIMVVNGAKDRETPRMGPLFIPALILASLVTLIVWDAVDSAQFDPALVAESQAVTVQRIGAEMFNFDTAGWYILFQLIGLVLLVALTGAVLLAKRQLNSPASTEPTPSDDHH